MPETPAAGDGTECPSRPLTTAACHGYWLVGGPSRSWLSAERGLVSSSSETHNPAVEAIGYLLWVLLLLVTWSSVIGALLGRMDFWEAVPGASPWRLWGPGLLAWSWPVPMVAGFLLVEERWANYLLVLLPLGPLIATALTVVEFRRRRAEDLASGTPRRLKL